MHLSGPSRVIKFLNAPERPDQGDKAPLFTGSSTPHSIGPRPPYARVHKTAYAPMITVYSLVRNVLDACISITWGSGSGLGPGIREFFGPCEMALS